MDYCIRQVRIEDAEQLIEYVDQVSGESDNLTFGKGEFKMPLDKEVTFLQSIVDDLPPVYQAFYQDIDARTCPNCQEVHPGKEPPKGWVTLDVLAGDE